MPGPGSTNAGSPAYVETQLGSTSFAAGGTPQNLHANYLYGGYFSLKPASRLEAIGLVFEGKLKVPANGEYTFFLESTDGARLTVGGKGVLNHPGKGRQRGFPRNNDVAL